MNRFSTLTKLTLTLFFFIMLLLPTTTIGTSSFHGRDDLTIESAPGWPVVPDPPFYTSRAISGEIDRSYSNDEILVGYEKPPMPSDPNCYGIIWMWHADGTPVDGWNPKILATPFYIGSEIRFDDIDNDDDTEIIIATKNNTSPKLDAFVYVFQSDGTLENGWPQSIGTDGACLSPPVIADLNNDGFKEIIVTSKNKNLYIFNYDGTSYLPGIWPKTLDDILYHSAAVANLDNDNELELVVGGGTNKLYAFNADGTSLNSNWPVTIETHYSAYTPTIQDIDNDQEPEILVGAGYHLGVPGKVYALTTDGLPLNENWPKDVDPYPFDIIVEDMNLEIPGFEILTAPRYSNTIYAWSSTGEILDGWPYANLAIEQIGLAPSFGDINGDSLFELVTSNICTGDPTGGKLIILQPDGTEKLLYSLGLSLQMPLTVHDVNHDGKDEIIQALIDLTNHYGPVGMYMGVTVHDEPNLQPSLKPGVHGRIIGTIKNAGPETVTNVTVTITVTGGVFHQINTSTTRVFPHLNAGEEQRMNSRTIFGAGHLYITIAVTCDQASGVLTVIGQGKQFLIFSYIPSE